MRFSSSGSSLVRQVSREMLEVEMVAKTDNNAAVGMAFVRDRASRDAWAPRSSWRISLNGLREQTRRHQEKWFNGNGCERYSVCLCGEPGFRSPSILKE